MSPILVSIRTYTRRRDGVAVQQRQRGHRSSCHTSPSLILCRDITLLERRQWTGLEDSCMHIKTSSPKLLAATPFRAFKRRVLSNRHRFYWVREGRFAENVGEGFVAVEGEGVEVGLPRLEGDCFVEGGR
jgi:hypothetical protein